MVYEFKPFKIFEMFGILVLCFSYTREEKRELSIRYPNGKLYMPSVASIPSSKAPIKKSISNANYSNRGMTLEDDLNESNQYYLDKGVAVIHKKPTPIQIVKVDYPKRSAAVIKEAYFRKASTTDFNGVYKGMYIDFEAKETKNKTSFPLSNFHEHQIEHMRKVKKQNGIAFVILRFSENEDIYLLDCEELFVFWDNQDTQRKSIPKTEVERLGYRIPLELYPRLDYLKVIDTVYRKNL